MKKLVFVVLAVFGLVSVSSAYELDEMQKSGEKYVKVAVEELDVLKKQGKLHPRGKELLLEGKDFLEFVEKVKQSPNENCFYAVQDVMSDYDNKDKYHYYVWSDTSNRCMDLRAFAENVRKFRKGLYREITNY